MFMLFSAKARKNLVLLFFALLACTIIYSISGALAPFIFACVVAYLFTPLIDRLESFGLARWISSISITMALLLAVLSVVFFVAPVLLDGISLILPALDIIVDAIARLIKTVGGNFGLRNLDMRVTNIKASIMMKIVAIINQEETFLGIVKSGIMAVNVVITIFCCPIILYYTMRDWHGIKKHFIAIVPQSYVYSVENLLQEINQNVSRYLHGQLIACTMLSIIYGFLLYITNLSFGVFVGILIGLLAFIPYIGFFIGFAVASLIALQQFGLEDYSFIKVVFALMIGQILDANFVTPRIIGNSIRLHPNWIIFGLFVSVLLFGFVGALLSLPISAISAVLARAIINLYKNSDYYKN